MKSLLAIFLSLAATTAIAAHHDMGMEVTPEQRKQMAEMHTKAAACLNSNRSIQECKDEMMKNCPMMKEGHCPMMSMESSSATQPKSKTTK